MAKNTNIKIVALTTEGKEYMYSAKSAHKVSKKNAQRIADELNKNACMIPYPDRGQKWFVYEICEFDTAYAFAQTQSFEIRNGYLYEKHYRYAP